RHTSFSRDGSSDVGSSDLGIDQHGARVLDQHRGVGDDVVELLAVLAGEDRLVLVGEQHVTGAVEEGGGGVPAAARQGDDVVEQRPHVLLGLGLGAAGGDHLPPGGQRVPAGGARRGGVGGDDLDAGAQEVVPVLDALR